jgi:hypothetical protein
LWLISEEEEMSWIIGGRCGGLGNNKGTIVAHQRRRGDELDHWRGDVVAHWGIMKELLWLISKEGGDEVDHWRGDLVAH